jgi:hypothetical protein
MPLVARPALVTSALLAFLAAAARADEPPFAVSSAELPGRPIEVVAAPVPGAATRRLVAVSLEGSAPDEKRFVTAFTVGPGGELQRTGSLAMPADVVSWDVADVVPGGDLEIALLASDRLEVRSLADGAAVSSRPIAPALPLPPRTRGMGHLPLLAPWTGDGQLSALVPALGGLAHVPLAAGAPHLLPFPLMTEYLAGDGDAGVRPGVLAAMIGWPEVARGNDDGDGRPDIFAFSRYDLAVYRTGGGALPAAPSRRASLRPFTPEEELRPAAESSSLFARDLDGDGLMDLVLHRTFGTLLKSDATTSIWRNPGTGADPERPPDAKIGGSGGFGSIFLEDLDGDGRNEALQLFVPFSVVQLVRTVVTGSVQAEVRIFRLEAPGISGATETYKDTLMVALDADRGRVSGILPNLRGDWNGDGLHDLLHGESLERLVIRLGAKGEKGPRFGGVVATQEVEPTDRAVIADFDGDGLDDLALFDTLRDGAGVRLLRNRGTLPGTAPEIRQPEPAAAERP